MKTRCATFLKQRKNCPTLWEAIYTLALSQRERTLEMPESLSLGGVDRRSCEAGLACSLLAAG